MNRDDVIGVRVTREVKAALQQAAAAEDRTLSKIVERILQQWLVATGRLTSAQKDKQSKPRPRSRRRGRR